MKDNRGIQGGPNRRRQSTVLAERRVCNSLHTRTLFAALLAFCLFAPPARAGQTSTYGFVADKSTITQTGGIAGIHRTYTITGTFQLMLDFAAGKASFARVDANAVDDSPFQHALDPNEVFNMTELSGVWIDGTTVRFNGIAHDGSSVLLTLTFTDGSVALKGGTIPPPNSADFFVFTLDAVAQRKYSGGTGEPNDPYQIATAADLIALGETPEDYDNHFLLTADIDMDPNLGGGKVFDKAVIAPDWETRFIGVFDGNDHTISHLTIKGEERFLGLFGSLGYGAEVKGIGLLDVNIAASGSYVGALVGWLYAGKVTHCYSTGLVCGWHAVGGLIGYSIAQGGSRAGPWVGYIAESYSTATVVGHMEVGGLVGQNWEYTLHSYGNPIVQCYSKGSVYGDSTVGGLVGGNTGRVTNSYSTGAVSGTGVYVGGLVGGYEDEGNVVQCFWDVQASGQATSYGGTGLTTAEMQMARTFLEAGWDFAGETANGTEDIWWILEGKDYPRLSWELPADDFEDGKAGPLWMLYEPQPEAVHLREVNGRLEVEAIAQSQNVDAIYVADGWRLDATKDFAIKVDFHFSPQGGGNGRVTLGVVPSLDPSAMQWAELEASCFESGPFYLYEVRDGSWVQEVVSDRSADGGTLFMSYNPDTDELYLSYTGFGKANAWRTVKGILKGRWASKPVSVILSGGSQGLALTGADAWMDNFAVSSGALILN